MIGIFVFFLLIPYINCFCDEGPAKVRQTSTGRSISLCTLDNGLEILNGSVVHLANCKTCTCSEAGLSCCGTGAMAGVGPTPPKECKYIRDGCVEIMVRRADETKHCYGGQSIMANTKPVFPYAQYYGYVNQIYGRPQFDAYGNSMWPQHDENSFQPHMPYWLDTVPTRDGFFKTDNINNEKSNTVDTEPSMRDKIYNGYYYGPPPGWIGNDGQAKIQRPQPNQFQNQPQSQLNNQPPQSQQNSQPLQSQPNNQPSQGQPNNQPSQSQPQPPTQRQPQPPSPRQPQNQPGGQLQSQPPRQQ